MNLLKGSAMLKLAALAVALLTYAYIRNEITRHERETVADPSYKLIKLTAKNLPVKVRLDPARPSGFRVVEEGIVVSPPSVTVIGPEALFDEAVNAETSTVDVREYTKTITRQVPLESVAGIHVVGEPMQVVVTVPIEKIPEPESPQADAPVSPTSEALPPTTV